MLPETFRLIPGIDRRYVAGSDGHIYSSMKAEMRALNAGLSSNGYYHTVSVLLDGGRRVSRNVHNLVCAAFHGLRPTDKHVASHFDGNSHNNLPENLLWETQADNLKRRNLHGTHDRGLNNSRSCLTIDALQDIRLMLSSGSKHQDIADKHGISRTVVSDVFHNKKYQDFS